MHICVDNSFRRVYVWGYGYRHVLSPGYRLAEIGNYWGSTRRLTGTDRWGLMDYLQKGIDRWVMRGYRQRGIDR